MTKEAKKIQERMPALKDLEAIIGDTEVTLFFLAWIKNGRDATKAYMEIKPNVTAGSAKTLGSRMLSRVDRSLILGAYGLDIKAYMDQLQEGLAATRLEDDGEGIVERPDHRVRRDYHKALGQIIGVEGLATTNVQVNIGKTIDDWTAGAYEDVEEAEIVKPVEEAHA